MSRSRRLHLALPVAAVALAAAGGLLLTQWGVSAPDKANGGQGRADKPADLKPAVSLPISQVILFNSGVGHFTRSGVLKSSGCLS